ncbi:hypothetical protein ACVJF2_001566 [Bradyrhizobium sp. USDA 4519]
MFRGILTLTLSLCIGAATAPAALAQTAPAINEQEAHAIAVDAYIYFYPLLTMDITRKQFTNVEPGKDNFKGPMNTFVNVPEYPPANFKGVVRSNFDTLYSVSWLDMTKEPVVVSVPDTDGRFYLLPMLDMWSDVFASPGWRTTGTKAGTFLVTAPGWRPDLRDRFAEEFKLPKDTQRIDAPTPYVWVIGRTKTDGPPDYDAVHKIQAGYKVTPLSEFGKTQKPTEVRIDPSVDMKTAPKVQVDTMSAGVYFAQAAELLKLHPPHITDEPIIAQMKRIGIEPGKSFEISKVDPVLQRALETAPQDGQKLMAWKVPTLARVANGWSMNTDTMGVYGNYYLKRAIVAQLGLGANLPEDAIYPLNLADNTGKPLDGANKYTITFEKGAAPPRQCLLVDHALRPGRIPGRQRAEPLRCVQLDAVQIQPGRLARSLLPERKSGRGQTSQLAPGAEGRFQPDHAPLRSEIGGADRKVESSADRAIGDSGGSVSSVGFNRTDRSRGARPQASRSSPEQSSSGLLPRGCGNAAYAALLPSWRLASNRNQVRRSVSSMKVSSRPAVPESSWSSASLCALRIAAAMCLLSSINSRSISRGGT